MGYDFDLTKMPSDMKALYYQTAAKEGHKAEIDTELEYSIFKSRAKSLLDSGKASYTIDVYNDIFSVKMYQNKISPTEKEAERITKLLSDNAQNVEFEKIDSKLYKYTITYGDIKKLDYSQSIGTIKIGEKDCYAGGKTYSFYKDGNMEVNEPTKNKSTLYDQNNTRIE